MKLSQLQPFAPLYRAARYFDASRMLSSWLGLGDEVLPLLLPHGVELPGQYENPADIGGIEPIYWAINAELYERARHLKPSLLIPHPFLLGPSFARSMDTAKSGVLVIGVPPGRSNDRALFEALGQHGVSEGTILVKRRAGWEGSCRFWEDAGFQTLMFGEAFQSSYDDMARELSRFEHVYSTSTSTAALFASACGGRVTLIRDCPLQAYEFMWITDEMMAQTPQATAWLRAFVDAPPEEQRALVLGLLGADHMDRDLIKTDLLETIEALDDPLDWSRSRYPRSISRLQAHLAIRLNKPRLAAIQPHELFPAMRAPKVGIITMRENDYYLDGPSADTFSIRPVRYRRGITEPGTPVDPY